MSTNLSPCHFCIIQKTSNKNNEQQLIPKTLLRSAIGTYFLKVLGNPEKLLERYRWDHLFAFESLEITKL